MMLKLVGAAMLVACGAMLGMGRLNEEREKIKLIDKIIRALGMLEGEIKLCSRALPDAFEKIARELDDNLFANLSETCLSMNAGEAWKNWTENLPLPSSATQLLHSLGECLGQSDGEKQAMEIVAVRTRLVEMNEEMRSKIKASAKNYPLIGACFAGMAAMMII